MSDDLPKRLRDAADRAELNRPKVYCVPEDIAREAADEIERLRAALKFMISNEEVNKKIAEIKGEAYVNKGLDYAKSLLPKEKKDD